jgi:hypothetical protein
LRRVELAMLARTIAVSAARSSGSVAGSGAPSTQRVVELAVGVDVEWLVRPRSLHEDDAARAQRMPHAQLVPDIGVVERQVGNHQVGDQQFLEHVGPDIAGAGFFVSAEDLEAGRLERRPNVLRVDAIEVDQLTIVPRLAAERHTPRWSKRAVSWRREGLPWPLACAIVNQCRPARTGDHPPVASRRGRWLPPGHGRM